MEQVHYQCTRCTNCCRWPGDVHLTDADVAKISRFLGLSELDFVREHTRLNRRRTGLSLLEHPAGECVWLEGIDCRLQPVKPEQCRKFPNEWNFPGWREMCESIEIRSPAPPDTLPAGKPV